ncbi:protein shisa-5 isoform X5 [Sitodiplosis mosellana]|uniref:protein shisa-5 isoform X5 n=1 Tax=Sitodiplosis mosellana TaxID=263140 RepID=UPI0024452155|nr:protein shisa-5 isoform X5 [Sitodiplosis mosellana]
MDVFWFIVIVIIIFLTCAMCKAGKRKPIFSAPVVVTTTTIPTVPQSAGYPAQSTIVQGYPMPQPQPGYPPQPAGMYPNQPMPQPYPMPPIQADYNPPSYDQVVRGGDAYQKQAPYNPNYSGQQ